MNVTIEPFAVGAARGRENLFVVEGSDDYCNSLRAPAGEVVTTPVPVEVISIDEYIGQTGMAVNFLKIDVEGAELDVLRGGRQLLSGTKRPVVLAEVYDLRTKEWGYRAREIVGFLSQLGYEWFEVGVDGLLQPISSELESYDANLVAVPRERAEQIREELREK